MTLEEMEARLTNHKPIRRKTRIWLPSYICNGPLINIYFLSNLKES